MSTLFNRIWRVTVGLPGTTNAIQFTDLDIEFEVKKTLKPEPNTCDLKIYGLSADHRAQIQQNASNPKSKIVVRIEAGYKETGLTQIYLGDLRASFSVTQGPETITELSTGDGEKTIATARMNVPFGPGTPMGTVLQEILSVLGLGPGNVQQALAQLQAKGISQFNIKGVILKGNAADHLTDLTKSVGMEWSIQDDAVQILNLGQPLQGQAIQLDSNTGLIGSPSVDSKGILSCETLMIPGVKPGVILNMNSANFKGGFRISQVTTKGQSLGNDWGHDIQSTKY